MNTPDFISKASRLCREWGKFTKRKWNIKPMRDDCEIQHSEATKNLLKNTCGEVLFLIKLQSWRSATLFKRDSNTPTQMLSCEYCEIFKNIFFENHRWIAESEYLVIILCHLFWKKDRNYWKNNAFYWPKS